MGEFEFVRVDENETAVHEVGAIVHGISGW
jgi:hypothetical protein